jgi:hypothetical protein
MEQEEKEGGRVLIVPWEKSQVSTRGLSERRGRNWYVTSKEDELEILLG